MVYAVQIRKQLIERVVYIKLAGKPCCNSLEQGYMLHDSAVPPDTGEEYRTIRIFNQGKVFMVYKSDTARLMFLGRIIDVY